MLQRRIIKLDTSNIKISSSFKIKFERFQFEIIKIWGLSILICSNSKL